jgi:DNA-binding transcriptional LysR family regulator
VKEIEFLSESEVGEVRIACPEAVAAGILPPIIDRMSRRYPRVAMQVLNWTEEVFRTPARRALHALMRPASEKRQGTKSRWVGHPAGQRALWGFGRVVGARAI